jgi:hypothetical protein
MDTFLTLTLLFIIIILVVGLLLYFIPKKLGYNKTGKYLTSFYILIISTIIIYSVFEDKFFSKNDALNLILEQGIDLEDDYELLDNKSMSAIGEYYHTFTLKISERDKINIIGQIKKSKNFKKINEPISAFFQNKSSNNSQTHNYETETLFIREYFKQNNPGYAPTFRSILIKKTDNILIFEEIDD